MIRIISLDLNARTVTFTANGQQKTISGLGEFPSQKAFVEYLESIARTDMPAASVPLSLDVRGLVGSDISSGDFPEPKVPLPR